MSEPINQINIRPGVSILSVLRHLNYRAWYALAEFVDNALQSYLQNEKRLKEIHGNDFILEVRIHHESDDGGKIVISDNAAGIPEEDIPRAFRPAEIPPDRSGLNEFGMGMKSAACWFAEEFTVHTGALGEGVVREVSFDVNRIIEDKIEELSIFTHEKNTDIHFTVVTLNKLHQPLATKTIPKIKDHLTGIYRQFVREGKMKLYFNGEELSYSEPRILRAKYYKDEKAEPVLWRKDIDFDFGGGLSIHGFAALRETASTSRAGFALFRRNRVIQGSADEGYRPEYIFKKSNSYTYQRLFGELHLEGFEVSHTKDGFKWDENEETFLELLKQHLDEPPLPLLNQAEGHRARVKPEELMQVAEIAVKNTAEIIENEAPDVIQSQVNTTLEAESIAEELQPRGGVYSEKINIEIGEKPWEITLETSLDPTLVDWINISSKPNLNEDVKRIGIRMSMTHPFVMQFCGTDPEKVTMLLRVVAAIVLAEVTARDSGVKYAGEIRKRVNEYLKKGFSKP